MIERFFQTHWLAFHCIVFPLSVVRRELHKSKGDMLQKHFTLLLTDKIEKCMRVHGGREQS